VWSLLLLYTWQCGEAFAIGLQEESGKAWRSS
jgi:hypothetical protein